MAKERIVTLLCQPRLRLLNYFEEFFIKAIEDFFRVNIASSKHEEGWVNLRQLCKPEMLVCRSVSNSPNPLCV